MNAEERRYVEDTLREDIRSLDDSLKHIANAVIFRYEPEIPTCAISRNWVLYYGDWLADLALNEYKQVIVGTDRRGRAKQIAGYEVRTAAIEHEVHHIIRGHFDVRQRLDELGQQVALNRWNRAEDLEINGTTASVQRCLRGTLPGGESAVFPDALGLPDGNTTEWYYRKLEEQARAMQAMQAMQAQQSEQSEDASDKDGSEGKPETGDAEGGPEGERNGSGEESEDKSGEGTEGQSGQDEGSAGEESEGTGSDGTDDSEPGEEQGSGGSESGEDDEGEESDEDESGSEDGSGDKEESGSGDSSSDSNSEGDDGNDNEESGDGFTKGGGEGERGEESIPDDREGGCGHTGEDDLTFAEIEEQRKKIREAAANTPIQPDWKGKRTAISEYVVREANLGRAWSRALQGVLATYIGKRGHGRPTYAQPPRRGQVVPGVVRPGEIRTHAKVAVVIDTSGSMQKDAISAGINVVAGLCRMLGGRLHVTLFDYKLQWAGYSANGTDIVKRLPKSGGGTEIEGMIAAAASTRPEVIVLLSDCRGNFPATCPVPVVIGRINSDTTVTHGWIGNRFDRMQPSYVRAVIQVPLQPRKG